MPVITVIVPIFNAEYYLAECIDSILRQSFTDFELLLIDDGSTDRSSEICKRYQEREPRIRLLSQTNAGQSSARNLGLAQAWGEYVAFIDADDTVSSDYLLLLYDMIKSTSADISCVDYCTKMSLIELCCEKTDIEIYTKEEAIDDTLYQKRINGSVWSKLFRKSLFTDVKFEEGIIYEDLDIIVRLYERSNLIAHKSVKAYFYRKTPGSSLSVFSEKRFSVLDITDCIFRRYDNTIHFGAARDRKFSACFNMLVLIFRNKADYPEKVANCYQFIKQVRIKEVFDKNVRLKNKVGALVSFFGLSFIKFLAKRISI